MNKIKNNSYNQFKKLGYPSKKLESWKFSNSSHLKKYDTVISNSNIDIKEHLEKKNTLCFVNGVFIKDPSLSLFNDFFVLFYFMIV